MVDVPRQNWSAYEARAEPHDAAWIRGLSTSDRFTLYAELFDMVCAARPEAGDVKRLEDWRWQQKFATRRQAVAAFAKLDEPDRVRAATHNAR